MQPNSPALQLIQANDAARVKTTAQLEQDALNDVAPFPYRQIGDVLSDPDVGKKPDWIVQTLFVLASLNVVYGAGKIGKSTLLAHLAVAVALGTMFAGMKTKQGPVLWIDLEQGTGRLARSLMSVQGVNTPGIPLYVYSDLSANGRSFSALAATLASQDFVLVVIDSLGKFAQIEDENDNAAWQRVLQRLEELARSGSAAIVFIDHDRKGEGEYGRGLRGASSKLAAMDCAVHIKRSTKGKDDVRCLEVVSRESGTFSFDLALTGEGFAPAADSPDVVEKALRNTGPMSTEILLAHLEREGFTLARSTVQTRLNALTEQGKVVSTGTGKKGDAKVYAIRADSADCAADIIRHNDTKGGE